MRVISGCICHSFPFVVFLLDDLYSLAFCFSLFLCLHFFPLCPVRCKQSSDFSDISESAADYFSRSNRRGSIVSDLDDLSIPDLDIVSDQAQLTTVY